MTAKPKPIVAESTLVQQRQEGLALIQPLKQSVVSIDIETAEDYANADGILARIRQGKANWLARINPIIEPIRSGLDLLYGLRTDITDPLDEMETTVKRAMKAYKIQEARQIQEANEEKERQRQALEKQLSDKEAAEAKAKTPAMQQRILESKAKLQQAIAESKAAAPAAPIKAAGSSARTIKHWRVTDMQAFLTYIVKQGKAKDLFSLVVVDSVQMNAYFKLEQPKVGEWIAGVEVYEDINIAGRK